MSPLVITLGIVGNVLSTVSILPHLVQSIRERRPVGSIFGWTLGAVCGLVWITYGILAHNMTIGAPNWITVPIGAWLGVWCWLEARQPEMALVAESPARASAPARHAASVAVRPTMYASHEVRAAETRLLPAATHHCARTAEMPRLVSA